MKKFSPDDAMNPLSDEFREQYAKACTAMLGAVKEFERVTRRVVSSASVTHIDVTRLADTERQYVMNPQLDFLPTLDEWKASP